MFDILVAGEINPDLILTGDVMPEFGQEEKIVDSAILAIGSSAAIFACGTARLGLKVAFIGVCGDDLFGHFMLEEMSRRNVNISNVIIRPGGVTGLSVVLNRESDRAIMTHLGLISALNGNDLPDGLLRQARHLHVASFFLQTNLQPGLPRLFSRAHALGLTTSLDPNYDPVERWTGLEELLSETDVFLPNRTEALSITQAGDIECAARQLAQKAHLVVAKLGADGALACQGESITSAKTIPVNIVDSIGSGDSFDAGFIFGYLNQWSISQSLSFACVCGALSMEKAGGTDGQPTFQEAIQHLS